MNDVERKKYLEDIKNNLTINQIYDFLVDVGGEPQMHENLIISRTICHNPPGHGSFKLYYYDNTKLFRCYTQCEDSTFDIFQLVLKIKTLEGSSFSYWSKDGIEKNRPWNLPDAVHYITIFFGIEEKTKDFFENHEELQDWKIFDKMEAKKLQKNRKQIVSLNVFEDHFLDFLPKPKIIPWLKEGITQENMNLHKICYDPKNQGIVIPHYNIDNQLIGVRERTLIKENEERGKYIPAKINGQMYNHPLSFNLYNINISKNNIRNIKKAIVYQGEKSCLKYGSYFGIENDISVAACGSSLINYQVELLLSLGVDEIIVGFDRQYKEVGDISWQQWTKKLYHIHDKYGSIVQISYLFDKNHLLDYKSSPIDHGKDVFLELFKNRIQI